MADNYLENKLEQYNKGKAIIKKANPSLETLLKIVQVPIETQYPVKKAQFDAMLRAASEACDGISYKSEEAENRLTITSQDRFILGIASHTIRLKAAELGLKSEIIDNNEEIIICFGK